MLKIIEQDTTNWDTVSRVKEKEKLEIDITGNKEEPYHVRITTGSWNMKKTLSRTINHLFFYTIADAEGTVGWLQNSRGTTKKHIQKLVHIVKDSHDIQNLSKAVDSLYVLKKTIQEATSLGYQNLKQTYDGRVTQKGGNIKDILSKEQDKISEDVINTLSQSIMLLGAKIQENKLRASLNEDSSSDDDFEIIERSFNLLSEDNIDIEQLLQPSSDDLIDPYADERWQNRRAHLLNINPEHNEHFENGLLAIQLTFLQELDAQNSILFCKTILKENSPLEEAKNKQGEIFNLPNQFYRDLPRMNFLKVNDKLVYSNIQPYKYDHMDGYKNLEDAFISVDQNRGKIMAERTSRLLTQTASSDITKQLIICFSDDDKIINLTAKSKIYQTNVESDKAVVTLKTCFSIKDPQDMEKVIGCILTKRVITIPLDELKDEDLENKEDPAPGLTVTDKFSKLIDIEGYAIELLHNF